MAKTTIGFFGGVNAIGGNKITLQAANDRAIMFDFGIDYGVTKKFTDAFMKLRESEYILDALSIGLIPRPEGVLECLYREDLVLHVGEDLKSVFGIAYGLAGKPLVTDVAVSHLHGDHVGLIKYMHSSINPICGATSASLLDLFERTRNAGTPLRSINEYKLQYKLDGTKVVSSPVEGRRTPAVLAPGDRCGAAMGGLEVSFHETDHSIPGAGGFLAKDTATGKKVVYTGDIRVHGPLESQARAFVRAAKEFKPDALIIEGTRLERGDKVQYHQDEASVKAGIEAIIEGVRQEAGDKMVFFDCSGKDVWRFQSFYQAAKAAGRRLVIDADVYLLIEACKNAGIAGLASIDLNDVLIYLYKARSGLYEPSDYSYSNDIATAFTDPAKAGEKTKYKRINLGIRPSVRAEHVRAHPGRYLMYLSFYMLNELPDLRPPEGSHFVKSMSEPVDDEGELSEEKRAAWLDRFGIPPDNVHSAHCSGHASPDALEWMVREIKPARVFPVHSLNPDLYEEMDLPKATTVVLPKLGEEYEL
ncbi:MAG: hypothetical protein JW839_13610 [Candidatus Lokiarchaeota archaeon]|nr:hypothetical protein [Candidatus Lokiarchaeota archaeon]